jgi:hypothetical protein
MCMKVIRVKQWDTDLIHIYIYIELLCSFYSQLNMPGQTIILPIIRQTDNIWLKAFAILFLFYCWFECFICYLSLDEMKSLI